MSTDNTTPRLTKELMGVYARLEVIIPRIPIVVGRLDAEQPGFPTGHSGGGDPADGPDRYQTSDPAYCADRAALQTPTDASRKQQASWISSPGTGCAATQRRATGRRITPKAGGRPAFASARSCQPTVATFVVGVMTFCACGLGSGRTSSTGRRSSSSPSTRYGNATPGPGAGSTN